MAMKIGLGEITDTHLNNFGMITGGAKPGSSMYETALANLVKKGGDDLRGVSDPLEHIFSAVSRHIEENGMSPNMQKEHARISEAIAETNAAGPAGMGLVMKVLQPKIAGKADGGVVSLLVKDALK